MRKGAKTGKFWNFEREIVMGVKIGGGGGGGWGWCGDGRCVGIGVREWECGNDDGTGL